MPLSIPHDNTTGAEKFEYDKTREATAKARLKTRITYAVS
jgi:hypothetical protein